MTTRRYSAPMLYGPNMPAKWLRTLARAVDQAAGSLCRDRWQLGLVACRQPAHIGCDSPVGGKPMIGYPVTHR